MQPDADARWRRACDLGQCGSAEIFDRLPPKTAVPEGVAKFVKGHKDYYNA